MDATVLIVEDETAIVTMLRYNLEREGMRVIEAGDGEEALKILAETRIDLMLLDWMLPVMSGIEVCRQIRRKPEWRDLPVIMVTARGEEGDRIRGLDTGADDYVTKPFAIGELLARVRALLLREPGQMTAIFRHWRPALAVGVSAFLASVAWFTALTLQNAAYVRAVGQIELVFTFIASVLFFKEKTSPLELFGIALILAAILLLILAG